MVGLPHLQELGTEIELACEAGKLEDALQMGGRFLIEAQEGIQLVQDEHETLQSKL